MKYKIFVLFNCMLATLFCQNKIDVFLSFNDCITCFSTLNSLNNLDNFEKTIVAFRKDSLILNEFFENIERPKDTKYFFSDTKAIYNSYCQITTNKILTDSFPLNQLSEKISTLNNLRSGLKSISKKNITVFNLPKTVVFQDERINLYIKNENVVIYDYILNKIISFKLDLLHDSVLETLELKGNQFPPRLFLKTANFDSILYNKHYNELKQMGKGFPHIESVFMSDSSLFLLLNFPFTIKIPNDIGIVMSFFLYEKNLISKTKHLTYINDEKLLKKNIDEYIDNTRPFYMNQNKLFLSVYNDVGKTKTIKMFSSWKKEHELSYDFESIEPLSLTKNDYLKNSVDSFDILINNQFYFNIKGKLIINYETNAVINLNNFELDPESYVLDLIAEENLFKILTIDKNNEVHLIKYDLKTQKTKSSNKIELPTDALENSLKFYNMKNAIIINKKHTKLFIFEIPG